MKKIWYVLNEELNMIDYVTDNERDAQNHLQTKDKSIYGVYSCMVSMLIYDALRATTFSELQEFPTTTGS